jgi:hypothetical protein
MGTPEQDAARRALGLEPLPDEPVQSTPTPVAVAEPTSERDRTRANLGLPPLDTQAQPAVTPQPSSAIQPTVTPPQVTSPQITGDVGGRKSQAELIEEFQRGTSPEVGRFGQQFAAFEERPADRDPLGRAVDYARIPGRVGAAYTSELIGLERALAEQLGIHGRIVDPLDISPDTAIQRLYRGEAGANPGLRELVDAINQRASERNFGQNLLLEAGSDPLNLIPGVGFTQLGRRGLGMSGPRSLVDDVTIGRASNLISEAPPSIKRQIALRNAVQQMQDAPSATSYTC